MVCSCPRGALAPRSATTSALPGTTQHKLQSDLEVAVTCAGFGDTQKRLTCKPKPAATRARPGATYQKYGVHRGQMLLV